MTERENRIMGEKHYGVVIRDGDYGSVYGYSFSKQELLDWLNEPVDFTGVSGGATLVETPGSTVKTEVSIGSTLNDKLNSLLYIEDGEPHRWITPVKTPNRYESHVYWELLHLCDKEDFFMGLMY